MRQKQGATSPRGARAYVSLCKLNEKWNCHVEGASEGKLPLSSENVMPI